MKKKYPVEITIIALVMTAIAIITCTSCRIPPEPRTNKIYEAYCTKVYDGDTIRVSMRKTSSDGITYKALVKVRLVGIDTPEVRHGKKRAQPGAYAAKSFTKASCLGKTIYLDIDDEKPKDKYGRTLALVYLDQETAMKEEGEHLSLNADLLRKGLAKPLYIPPSEFNPYSWIKK